MRDEERRVVRRERAARALNEAQELRDVPSLLLDKRRARVEVAGQQLRAIEELKQECRRAQLGGATGVVGQVLDEAFRRSDGVFAGGGLFCCDLLEDFAERRLPTATSFHRAG